MCLTVPPEDFFALLTFFHFLIHRTLFLAVLVFSDVDPAFFVLDLYMKYTAEMVPLCTYIVWSVIM